MTFAEYRTRLTYYLFAPHLEKGEKILLVAHRHPFLMIKESFKIGFFHFFLPIFFWNVFPEIWFIFLVWVIYGVVSMNRMIFNWYFDAILITDKQIIDVKWNGPFDRSSERLEYQNIDGTTIAFKGYLQTFFNYGTITVKRQGGAVGVELEDAINPANVESVILKFQEVYLSDRNMQDIKSLKSLLTSMIKKHAEEMKEIEVDF